MTTASTATDLGFRRHRVLHWACVAVALSVFAAAYSPISRVHWLLENALAFAFIAVMAWSYRCLPLSDTSYVMLAAFLSLHEWGAHYKYSDVPFGEWMKPWLGTSRNDFDRIVHFSYGLLCSYPLQELGIRTGVRGAWRSIVPMAAILAFSALYEITEALMAVLAPSELSNDFSGLQGDAWDAQKDMLMAGLGSLVALSAASWWRARREAHAALDRSLALAARAK